MKSYFKSTWIALLVTGALGSTPAFATAWHQSNAYFAYYDFRVDASGQSSGKTVSGIFLHTALLLQESCGGSSTGTSWSDIRHVEMTRHGQQFFAKEQFIADDGQRGDHANR